MSKKSLDGFESGTEIILSISKSLLSLLLFRGNEAISLEGNLKSISLRYKALIHYLVETLTT